MLNLKMINIYQHHVVINLATQEDDETAKVPEKMGDDVITWIPNNIKSSIIVVPPEGTPMSRIYAANNTPLKFVCQRVSVQFYKRKASCIGIKMKDGWNEIYVLCCLRTEMVERVAMQL